MRPPFSRHAIVSICSALLIYPCAVVGLLFDRSLFAPSDAGQNSLGSLAALHLGVLGPSLLTAVCATLALIRINNSPQPLRGRGLAFIALTILLLFWLWVLRVYLLHHA